MSRRREENLPYPRGLAHRALAGAAGCFVVVGFALYSSATS